MPQELEIVYEVATGKPVWMHSVDAAEACTLGDYSRMPASGQEPSDEEKAAALTASRGMLGTVHPELQTPEERAETRRQANEAATMAEAHARLQQAAFLPPPSAPAPGPPPHARAAHVTPSAEAEADAKAKADAAKK